MAIDPRAFEAQVLATAAVLDLPIAAEHLPGVLVYFALAADMAALVNGLPLGRDDETGAVFRPVSPPEVE